MRLHEISKLPATPENIERAKSFVFNKWCERHVERYPNRPLPTDLSGSCKFTSMFAQAVFGGTIEGNYDHQFVRMGDGTILDLNIDAEDVREQGEDAHEHDDEWWGNPEHLESMRSNEPRVGQWITEFKNMIVVDKYKN